MSSTSPVIPRNAKLSAYYTHAPQSPASPASPPTSTPPRESAPTTTSLSSLPTTNGRESVISYANTLTRENSLPDLMRTCSQLRQQSDKLSTTLQTASLSTYTHLSKSSQASIKCLTLSSETLSTTLPSISETCTLCTHINNRLNDSRADIDALNSFRKASYLLQACHVLKSDLKNACSDVVQGLCTKPEDVRDRVVKVCKRAYVVYGLVDGHMNNACIELNNVMVECRNMIRVKYFDQHGDDDGDGDEVEIISILDAARIRLWLYDTKEQVSNDFIKYIVNTSCSLKPTVNSLNTVHGKPLHKVVLYISLMNAEILPYVTKLVDNYYIVFKRDGNESDDHLIVSLSEILEESVSTHVRQVFLSDQWQNGTHVVQDVKSVKEGLKSLLNDVTGIVRNVVNIFAQQLDTYVDDCVLAMLQTKSFQKFKVAVHRDERYEDCASKLKHEIETLVEPWTEIIETSYPLIIQQVITSEQLDKQSSGLSFEHLAIGSKVMHILSFPSAASILEQCAKQAALNSITNSLTASIKAKQNIQYIKEGIQKLKMADEIGRKCGIASLKRARDDDVISHVFQIDSNHLDDGDDGDDDDDVSFLDDGWLARRLIKHWLSEIRLRQFEQQEIVFLIRDAKLLKDVTGYDVIQQVQQLAPMNSR